MLNKKCKYTLSQNMASCSIIQYVLCYIEVMAALQILLDKRKSTSDYQAENKVVLLVYAVVLERF